MSLENLPFKIDALKVFDKKITLPSSKSHSNRALIIGAVRGKNFKVHNVSNSSDVSNLISAFKKMGLKLKVSGTTIEFENSFPNCEKDILEEVIHLETGDGGTTNRFLLALLSLAKKQYHLYPTEKMSERPIEDLINPLKKLNVSILFNSHSKSDKKAWIVIKGPALTNNTDKLQIDCEKSTQFATAMMLAFSNSPLTFEFVNLHASETYLKMTEQVIKKSFESNSYIVPVDFSSLSYPVALAALMGQVLIKNCTEIDFSQADSVLIEILKTSGAKCSLSIDGLEIKKALELKPLTYNISSAPDLFPTLVFLAAHIEGESVFSDLKILQFKESDRLMQMISLLKAFEVSMTYDSVIGILKIQGKSGFIYKSAVIRPARDHRIVMAAALFMAKNSGGELYELDCVEKSFPAFLSLLE